MPSRSKTDKDKTAAVSSSPSETTSTSTTCIMEEILGPQLFSSVGKFESTSSLLKDTKLVGLYFSAAWCPPCQKFSPMLKRFYEQTSREDIQMVYISSDKTLAEFSSYYGKMPWLAMTTDKEAARPKNILGGKLKLQGIPTLVILDAQTGDFVTDQGRQQVFDASSNESECRKLVQSWIQQDKIPLDQAAASAGSQNLLVQALLAIAKNPMYMFAMLYFFKQIMRYLKGTNAPPEVDTPPLGGTGEDEF